MIRKLLQAADNGSEDPPRLVWDPTPSAPDHIRNRLFLTLANEAEEASLGTTAVSNLLRLTDVDLAGSQAPANADAVSAARTRIYERKQEQNRQAQKRFRSRKKEREQALENQLADTRQELQQLKVQQQHLEAKCSLLETVNASEQQSSNSATTLDGLLQSTFCYEIDSTDHGPGIELTLHGKQRIMTVTEISQLSRNEFNAIWSELIRELAGVLLHLSDHSGIVDDSLRRLTIDTSTLMGCMKQFNVPVYKAALQGRLDQHLHPATGNTLDAAWFSSLPSLVDLSREQLDDVLYVRQLYLTKRGLLAEVRNALVAQIHAVSGSILTAGDSATKLSSLTCELQQNAMQDYLIYIKVCAAVRRGVFTTEQWATMIVHCFPFYPSLESVFDALAATCLEPTVQDILASASMIPMTEEMQLFDDYIVYITDWYHHEYIPVPRVESSSKPAFPGPSKSAASLPDIWMY